MAKRSVNRQRRHKRDTDKKRRTSLLRRLSNKRASAEMQQIAAISSPTVLTPSRSFQSLNRSLSSQESLPGSPTRTKAPRSPPTSRLFSPSDSHSTNSSSQSSSPSSSVPNSPAGSTHYPRPSSLHGLKHKLAQTFRSPHRRKSVGHIPLSPLARTPSPSPLPNSPTRSPSPLTFPNITATTVVAVYPPGSSNTTQSYSPGSALTPGSTKKTFTRPKSAEPGSPLLRRALSPDRIHPRSADGKSRRDSPPLSISPLVTPSSSPSTSGKALISQPNPPRVMITTQSSPASLKENISSLPRHGWSFPPKPPHSPGPSQLTLRSSSADGGMEKMQQQTLVTVTARTLPIAEPSPLAKMGHLSACTPLSTSKSASASTTSEKEKKADAHHLAKHVADKNDEQIFKKGNTSEVVNKPVYSSSISLTVTNNNTIKQHCSKSKDSTATNERKGPISGSSDKTEAITQEVSTESKNAKGSKVCELKDQSESKQEEGFKTVDHVKIVEIKSSLESKQANMKSDTKSLGGKRSQMEGKNDVNKTAESKKISDSKTHAEQKPAKSGDLKPKSGAVRTVVEVRQLDSNVKASTDSKTPSIDQKQSKVRQSENKMKAELKVAKSGEQSLASAMIAKIESRGRTASTEPVDTPSGSDSLKSKDKKVNVSASAPENVKMETVAKLSKDSAKRDKTAQEKRELFKSSQS